MPEPIQSNESVPTLRHRRLVISANVLVQVVALLALVVMANWLLARHQPKRWDWTRSSYYKLSSKTEQVLKGLKEPLDIVVCIPTASSRDFIEKALQDTRNLLKEFQYVGKEKVRVEFVDPQRDLNRARQLVEKYHLDSPDQIIFACGNRHKLVKLDDTVDIEGGYMMGPPRIRAFKGEGVFLSAIQSVTQEKSPKVYFLTGHGERDPDSTDERSGYSVLTSYIKRDNILVEKWNWGTKQAWPTDMDALVIAGPQKRLSGPELNALAEYLKNNGRVMILLDYRVQSGLEAFLGNYGVQVDDDLIMMPLLGMINVTAIGEEYSRHPITEKLEGINTSFPYARSVSRKTTSPTGGGEYPDVTILVKTPDAFWGETDYTARQLKFDEKDIRGPLSLAVAVETRKPGGVELEGMRMVVVGTSAFVDNNSIRASEGNVDFFMNSLNWLLKREQQIAVSPKTPQEFRLDMTPRQARMVYVLVIGGMPLLVALLGVTVWMGRRK